MNIHSIALKIDTMVQRLATMLHNAITPGKDLVTKVGIHETLFLLSRQTKAVETASCSRERGVATNYSVI